VAGNHSDLFEVEKSVAKIIGTLGEAGIAHQGLFLNAARAGGPGGLRQQEDARILRGPGDKSQHRHQQKERSRS
jgi:hypothetical protein